MSFKAIIFDCDGVLMNSETLACRLGAKLYTEAGYPITKEQYMDTIFGTADFEKIVKAPRHEVKNATSEKKRVQLRELFEKELKETKYIKDVLDQIKLPYAIASGSNMERLEHSLKVIGLDKYFKDRFFSSKLVKKSKPAPDVFLYTAEKIGVDPKDCLVVEDSYKGAKGAIAAGMTVYGFIGGGHMTEEYIEILEGSGVEKIFSDMRDLLKWI